ncbi:hypothetical protein DOY81_015702, partial [Sarcophaga bullata]
MGINVSRQTDLAGNELLQRFVGRQHISAEDVDYWQRLLNYNITMPENTQEQLNLDSRLESLCQLFISNNLKTGNFGSLITVFLTKVSELLSLSDQESNMHIWQTFNALFIIRSVVKYIIETGSEFQLLQNFEAIPNEELLKAEAEALAAGAPAESTAIAVEATEHDDAAATIKAAAAAAAVLVDGSKFETFIDAIFNLIVVIPVKEFTYHLHLEAVNTLITL